MRLDSRKLQLVMARQELSTGDLAKKAGIATSTICRILNGTSVPTLKYCGKIANALGIDVTEILLESKKEQTQ